MLRNNTFQRVFRPKSKNRPSDGSEAICLMFSRRFGIWSSKKTFEISLVQDRSTWVHLKKTKYFAEIKNSLNAKCFAIQMIRESLRDHSRTWIGDTAKSNPDARVWCHAMLIPCCITMLFLSNFFDLSSTAFETSLFLCSSVWMLPLAVLDLSFKIEEFLHKMAISLSELKSWTAQSFFNLVGWPDWTLSSDPLLWFLSILSVHLCISSSVLLLLLRPLVGLRSPSNLFILSFCSTSPAAIQDTTPCDVLSQWWSSLSHSDTHNLNGYIVRCGCHEILIEPSITV